jgi:uncharacterized membrane protein
VTLAGAIETQGGGQHPRDRGPECGPASTEVVALLESGGAAVLAPASGYVQFIRLDSLVTFAADADAVISLSYRPGHFIMQGHPVATVWPPTAVPQVSEVLGRSHITGPYRTLTQDVSFGIDQLVEIAIRALSPAVNDTFTALTCIDWLGDSLCKVLRHWHPARVHRDGQGYVRVIAAQPGYERLVQRAFEKIRQAGQGMPAVMIRQLEALAKMVMETSAASQRRLLLDQAEMIQRASERSVAEASDRADVRRRFEAVVMAEARLALREAA